MPHEIKREKSFDCPSGCAASPGCTFRAVASWVEEEADDVSVARDITITLSATGSGQSAARAAARGAALVGDAAGAGLVAVAAAQKCVPTRFSLTSEKAKFELKYTPVADLNHPKTIDLKALTDAEATDHKLQPIPDVRPSFTLDYWDSELEPLPTREKGKPYRFKLNHWVVVRNFKLNATVLCRCVCRDARPPLKPSQFEETDLGISAEME